MSKIHVKWADSETRKIFNATPKSDHLMMYLEDKLFNNQLTVDFADSPRPSTNEGKMVYYYKPSKRLLTAAPRKREDYIHVVLNSGTLNKNMLIKHGFIIGKGTGRNQDVKLSDEEQIDTLISLLQKQLNLSTENEMPQENEIPKTLEGWVKAYFSNKETLEKKRVVDDSRKKFLSHFTEIDKLRSGSISFYDFKKTIGGYKTSRNILFFIKQVEMAWNV